MNPENNDAGHRAFVVKTASPTVPGYVMPGVWESLKEGKARIGWSYAETLDLRALQAKRQARVPLD